MQVRDGGHAAQVHAQGIGRVARPHVRASCDDGPRCQAKPREAGVRQGSDARLLERRAAAPPGGAVEEQQMRGRAAGCCAAQRANMRAVVEI